MENLGALIIDRQRLFETAELQGIVLTTKQIEQFYRYAELLLEWNARMNLTAITQAQQIEVKHFIDSMLFTSIIEAKGSIVDVGSGAGFPGLACKIYKPELDVTLLEPTGKRVQFLQEVSRELELDVCVLKERAEEAGRKKYRESYDVATARAVAALSILCEYCLPLVKVGGRFIAMKGAEKEDVPSDALKKLGAKYECEHEYCLPDGSKRRLIVFRKMLPTPPKYPRNGGVIAKRPL